MIWYVRSAFSRLPGNTLPRYVAHTRRNLSEVGYLIIEHVVEGRMLSESWKEHCGDPHRRSNLFRDLSRIMLSLAKLPPPRIGSWTMDDRGFISLTNRPLTFDLHQLENQKIPTDTPRNLTYASAEAYMSDLLACHDHRIRSQPNSIHNRRDGEDQLAALTMMRALLSRFTSRNFREGPFIPMLTDLHQSNIFVDEDWHVIRLIDLEWACVRPVEMLHPPHWLSSPSVGNSALALDEIVGEKLRQYAESHQEFMRAFESEEMALYKSDELTKILRASWESGDFWYMHALDSPTALYAIITSWVPKTPSNT